MKGSVNRMQTYMNWERIKTKMERDRWPSYKRRLFCSGKGYRNGHKTEWGPIHSCSVIPSIHRWKALVSCCSIRSLELSATGHGLFSSTF